MLLLCEGQLLRAPRSYRVTHKGCDFSNDLKLLKSGKFIGVSVFNFCLTLIKNIGNNNTVSDMLQSTELVKTWLDKLSTVVVEVASIVGNPVYILFAWNEKIVHPVFPVMFMQTMCVNICEYGVYI